MKIGKNRLILALVVLGPALLLGALILPALPHRLGQTKADILYINAALIQYQKTYKALPAGDSPAVFQSLMGSNLLNHVFLEGAKTNIVSSPKDYWGSPYQVEIVNGKSFLIRSAGPNKIFGDKDDYVFDGEKRDFTTKQTE